MLNQHRGASKFFFGTIWKLIAVYTKPETNEICLYWMITEQRERCTALIMKNKKQHLVSFDTKATVVLHKGHEKPGKPKINS